MNRVHSILTIQRTFPHAGERARTPIINTHAHKRAEHKEPKS